MVDDHLRAADSESRRPTYGELRRQLAENDNPWTVDPSIGDDELLPEYPLGGQPPDSEGRTVVPTLAPDVDIRDLIADLPPNDPGLRERWAAAGLPLDRVPPAVSGDRLDDAEQAGTARESGSDGERAPERDGNSS